LQPLFVDFFSSCASYWEYDFFMEFALEYTLLDVMVIIVVVANCPFASLLQNLK
jgi:hypothetical protein